MEAYEKPIAKNSDLVFLFIQQHFNQCEIYPIN